MTRYALKQRLGVAILALLLLLVFATPGFAWLNDDHETVDLNRHLVQYQSAEETKFGPAVTIVRPADDGEIRFGTAEYPWSLARAE